MKAINDKVTNEKILETIFNNTPFLIAYLDNNFNFIRVNRTYAKKHNKEPQFFIGKNHFDIYPDGNKNLFKNVIKTGAPFFAYSKPLEHPVSGVSYWDWAILPIKDDKNQVISLILSLTDVTDYKSFEDKIQKEQDHFIDELIKRRSKELLESERTRNESQLSELRNRITELENINKSLTGKLESNKDIADDVEAFNKLKTPNKDLKEIIDAQNPKIEELHVQVVDLKKAREETEKILSDKLFEINNLNQRITELEIYAGKKEELISERELEIEKLNHEIIELEQKDLRSSEIITKNESKISEINKNIDDLHVKLNNSKKSLSIKETEISKLNDEVRDLKLIQGDSNEIVTAEVLKIDELNEQISTQKQMIADLNKRNKILKEELENSIETEEMLLQLDELIKANDELEKFVETAANELQEPLRAIKSFINILSRRYRGKVDKDTDEFIDYALDAVEHLNRKIIGLLEYSRVESRGKEFKLTETEEIFDYAMNNLNASIEGNHAKITRDNLPKIMADSGQILQLFVNLLENAVKFKNPEQNPRVHVSAYPDKGNKEYVFSFEDNGIGIKEKDLEKIFDIFKKLNPEKRHKGIGLGLSIGEKIVHRHGGRFWVESELNIGSKFYFTIPFEDASDVSSKKSKRIEIQ